MERAGGRWCKVGGGARGPYALNVQELNACCLVGQVFFFFKLRQQLVALVVCSLSLSTCVCVCVCVCVRIQIHVCIHTYVEIKLYFCEMCVCM